MAEIFRVYVVYVILILVFKLMMLMLFLAIFVVVVLLVMMVIFWCLESSWLCVGVFWPILSGGEDVVSCVVKGVFVVVIVSICCCGDSCVHGELLVVKWWFLGGKFVFPATAVGLFWP